MNIQIITPAPPSSKAGNRATAARWSKFLASKGHQVNIRVTYDGLPADLMIALHAWRSADAIRLFRQKFPTNPLILALTGTDIYKFQFSHPEVCYTSMDQADLLIGLHAQVKEDIPECYWPKLRIVFQSAEPESANTHLGNSANAGISEHYDICVIGHLREEKDSLRAAVAARKLPKASKIRIIQAGKAHNREWQLRAEQEQKHNPRYHWLGEIPQDQVKSLMTRAKVMVLSSVMEGGANVVSEACVAGLPIIASDITGNIGLLGRDYPGYYPVRNTESLSSLMLRAEMEPAFEKSLQRCCITHARLFQPEKECAAINAVVEELRQY